MERPTVLEPGDIATLPVASQKVRVLRILEYIYESGEAAQQDMQRWGVPAQGRDTFKNASVAIRSGILIAPFDQDLDDEDRGLAGYRFTSLGDEPSIRSFQEQKAEAYRTGQLPEDAVRHPVDG